MFQSAQEDPAGKNIKHGAAECGIIFTPPRLTIKGKSPSCKIHAQNEQKIIEVFRIRSRHKGRQKIQWIADGVVMQGGKDVGAIADMEIPHGKGMLQENFGRELTEKFPVIGKADIMLAHTICIRSPDKGFTGEGVYCNDYRCKKKKKYAVSQNIAFAAFFGWL